MISGLLVKSDSCVNVLYMSFVANEMWMREIEVERWFWNFGRGHDRRRGLESAPRMEIIGAGSVWEER